MPVPTSISQLSATASANSPAGGESPITADDYLRAHASFIKQVSDKVDNNITTTNTFKTYGYTATAGQTTFSGNDITGSSLSYTAPYLIVSKNGLELRPVVDYAATSGTSVVLTAAASAGDKLQIQAFSSFNVANIQAANVSFSNGATGSSVRSVESKLKDVIHASDFGALGDGSRDDTVSLQDAFNAGAGKLVLLAPGAVYKCTSGLVVKGDVDGQGSTLKFYGSAVPNLVSQSVEGSLTRFTIDGANVTSCQNGLFVDTDFVQKATCNYDLVIKNISNSNSSQGCNAALFYKASSASVNLSSKLDIKIDVENVTATANGVIGDTGGSSTGILLSFNGVGTDSHVIVRDSIVKNILPVEDSGGIQLFVGDHTTASAKGFYLVENCKVYNAKKRGVKIQSQNTVVRDCLVDGSDTTVAFDTYAVDTVFERCKEILGSSTAFRTSGPNTVIESCIAEVSTQQPTLRLENGSNGASVRNSSFVNSATLGSVNNRVVLIEDSTYSEFINTSIATTGTTGSLVSLAGTCNVKFDECNLSGGEYGYYLAYSTGSTVVRDSAVNVQTYGFYRLGSTSNPITIRDTTINAGSIGLFLTSSAGANSATVDCDGSTIIAGTHGVLGPDGCRLTNNKFVSANTTGVAISCGNSVARNNQITKFGTGIAYDYTTTAEVANNVTIGTTAPYTKVGYTVFVDHNNNSR